MKKTYVKPELLTTEVKAGSMLMSSIGVTSTKFEGDLTNARVRGRQVILDDEEEDF